VYWLAYTAALSLGYAGILPPVISAWLVPLAFGAVSVYLFTTIPE
jgi:lipopolysaccharide export LptBFGC system permease protein LptF